MGVMMQAFYWDCPRHEQAEYKWWNTVREKLPELAAAGITSLWLPPPSKAANLGGPSMGYDPYDYFDLGEFNQKGKVETWFGTKQELVALIDEAHRLGMQALVDYVFNHNNGADEQELNPILNEMRWTKFTPLSGKFPRDWKAFHPSPYQRRDDMDFSGMPDLCHRNPDVYKALFDAAKWYVQDIGFDGFRFDFVKGYGSWLIRALMEYRYRRNGQDIQPYGVGELWGSDWDIDIWLDKVNSFSENAVDVFDFPLHYKLRDLCNTYGYDVRNLIGTNTVFADKPFDAVTFVDNHDTEREWQPNQPASKLLAYAFILTHEGYPCVFWKDYFTGGLQMPGSPNGIEALVRVHERYAGGTARILFADQDVYIMQRDGAGNQPGLVFVLNNRGDAWSGAEVVTRWQHTLLKPVAWGGVSDRNAPFEKRTDSEGRASFYASPRGYAVYSPE